MGVAAIIAAENRTNDDETGDAYEYRRTSTCSRSLAIRLVRSTSRGVRARPDSARGANLCAN
jgi:hypothetical protein